MPGRALLIGVPTYDSDVIADLGFVTNDLTSLSDALVDVGYDVSVLGASGNRPATHNAIISGVHEFCRLGVRDEVALLYFSGHGMHYRGKDFLVPADAELSDEIIEQMMVPVDFAAAYEQSRAASIIFFIDACREGVELGEKGSLSLQNWSQGKIDTMEGRQSAYVFACGPGEVSRFVPGTDGFSLFSRALTDTFVDNRSPLMFGRVRLELQQRLDRLADKYEKKRQSVRIVAEQAGSHRLDSVQISSGRASGVRSTAGGSPNIDLDALTSVTVSQNDLVLFSQNLDGKPPWVDNRVTTMHLLRGAAALEQTVTSVLENLKRYESAGITLPEITAEVIAELSVDRNDLILLPATDGTGRGRFNDRVPGAHVLYAANQLGESVDAVLQRLRRFEAVGIQIPQINHDAVVGLMVTSEDLVALSQDFDGQPPWVSGELSGIHLLRTAHMLDETVGAAVDRLRRFEPVGIRIPEVDQKDAATLRVTDRDVRLLSRDLDGEAPWLEPTIPVAQILYAAVQLEVSVGTVIEELARLSIVGLTLPTIDADAVAGLSVTSGDLVLLSVDLDGRPPWLEGEVTSTRILLNANRIGDTVDAIMARLRRFEPVGLRIPDINTDAAADLRVSNDDILLLSGGQRDAEGWWLTDRVPVAHLLYAAHRLNEEVGEVFERLRKFEAVGIDIPQLDETSIEGLWVTDRDLVLLSQDLDGGEPWIEDDVTWIHLLRTANQLKDTLDVILEDMRRFAPFGISLPEIDSTVVAGLEVTKEDLVLLSRDLDADEPWVGSEVSVIHLLRAANRLDQSVAHILRQMQRFELAGVSLPEIDYAGVDGLDVSEEDLRMLSQNLDAAAPWLDGPVRIVHVLFAASELGEPVDSVLGRLRRFEPIGIAAPELDDADGLFVSSEDLVLLSLNLDGRPPWVEGEIPVIHLLCASNRLEEPIGDTRQRLRKLEDMGVMSTSTVFSVPGWPERMRRGLSRFRLTGGVFP